MANRTDVARTGDQAAGNKVLRLTLPKGLDLQVRFIDSPVNNPQGPVADPNATQPVKPQGTGEMFWDGCGCGAGGNCVC